MWFKNLTIYQLSEPFTHSPEDLQQLLSNLAFQPCIAHQEFSYGWHSPVAQLPEQLLYTGNGFMLLCAKKQEKVLPTAVINELLTERITAEESQQARKLSKKEKTVLKEDLLFELLPKAFVLSKLSYAYIDTNQGWIIVDAASANKAEDLLGLLRKTLGSLPVAPLSSNNNPTSIMTEWLLNQHNPNDISIEDECELRSADDEAAIIRCKRQDLSHQEVINHLQNGKQVIKLAVTWADRLSFVLDENLAIKRLRFLDLIQEQAAEAEAESAVEQFDIEFSIMTLELQRFIPRLLEIMDGKQSAA